MKKRLLALLCAVSMIASLGFGTSANKLAVAAEGGPATVELAGATILKGTNATQSLRFLLKVKNYKSITNQDFGIEFTAEGSETSKTVSYKTQKKIYAIDGDTLEYAVEVKGIPYDKINTSITAKCFLEGRNETQGDTIKRSVQSVATAAGYTISRDGEGNIVTKADETSTDGYHVDLSTFALVGTNGKAEYNEAEDSVTVLPNGDKKPEGVWFKLPETLKKDAKYSVAVYGAASGQSPRVWFVLNDADTQGSAPISDVDFGKPYTHTLIKGNANGVIIKAPYGQCFDSLTITKIVVKLVAPAPETPAFVPVPTPTPGYNADETAYNVDLCSTSNDIVFCETYGNRITKTVNDDGTLSIVFGADGGDLGFGLPEGVYNEKSFHKVIIKYMDAEAMTFGGHTRRYGVSKIGWDGVNGDNAVHKTINVSEGSGEIVLDDFDQKNFSNFRFFGPTPGKRIRIVSVTFTN